MRHLLFFLVVCIISCQDKKSEKEGIVTFYAGRDTCFQVGSREAHKIKIVMLEDIEIVENTLNDTGTVNYITVPPGKLFRFFKGHSKDYLFDYEICCKSFRADSGKLVLKYVVKSL